MNEGFLKFNVIKNYEDKERLVMYQLTAGSNGQVSTIELHGQPDTFMDLAKSLKNFPEGREVVFEIGKEGNDPEIGNLRWSCYVLLKFYCYDPQGHVAIKVVISNNEENQLNGHKSEFSIISEIAAVNELGEKLLNWNPVERAEVHWETKTA